MIDYIFNLLISNSDKLPMNFYEIINKLEFNYKEEMLKNMQQENIQMIKEIVYILYELQKENYGHIFAKIKREELINLYSVCKNYNTDNFISYYKKAIINKYTNTS